MAAERFLLVAPSWIGDAILSEPLVALLRSGRADTLAASCIPHVRPFHHDEFLVPTPGSTLVGLVTEPTNVALAATTLEVSAGYAGLSA